MHNKLKTTLDHLLKVVEFDVLKGPYIVGSILTYQTELQFGDSEWTPNDIDIVARNEDQIKVIDAALKNIALSSITINKGAPLTTWDLGDNLSVAAIVHDVDATERVKWADWTIAAFATDGKVVTTIAGAISDVKNRVLRENPFSKDEKLLGLQTAEIDNGSVSWMVPRYYRYRKYQKRGYNDIDNKVYEKNFKYYNGPFY